jgi:UDP-sugar pyrophosphorylase
MNQLVFGLEDYCEALEATLGLVPEFVNPKYADAERKKFKKPTRLECMMQDFPRYFEASKVGFTTITGTGFAEKQGNDDLDRPISFYSPVKNNLIDAAAKLRKGQVYGARL